MKNWDGGLLFVGAEGVALARELFPEMVEPRIEEPLVGFRRVAFAAEPLEVRLFEGRQRGAERFPAIDRDATGVP